VDEIQLILKTQKCFLQDRDEEIINNLKPTTLTKADFNLIDLIYVTCNSLTKKRELLDQMNKGLQNENEIIKRLSNNFQNHKIQNLFEADNQILQFKNKLKQTQNLIDKGKIEELLRIKSVLIDSENIKQVYFKMNLMINSQAQVIDRIDYNLQKGTEYLIKANEELFILYDSYNNLSTSCQIILMIIIVILSLLNFIKFVR